MIIPNILHLTMPPPSPPLSDELRLPPPLNKRIALDTRRIHVLTDINIWPVSSHPGGSPGAARTAVDGEDWEILDEAEHLWTPSR